MIPTNQKQYRNLIVWQKSKELALKIYHILKAFPKEELYGLCSQMKRCSISVTSNIAEGNQRFSHKEKLRFFNIAQGSLTELDCQLDIAKELRFISEEDYKQVLELLNKTGYLLTRLIQATINVSQPH